MSSTSLFETFDSKSDSNTSVSQAIPSPKFNPKLPLKIYTDGGCQNNGYENSRGGCGFVVTQNDEFVEDFSDRYVDTSNNKMELRAIIEALKWCQKNAVKSPIIYSDSQYCINGCTIWKAKWVSNDMYKKTPKKPENRVLNADIWLELYQLQAIVQPSFVWVKAHNGNQWNEYVDRLASEGL
jgi:ribonuclease HI